MASMADWISFLSFIIAFGLLLSIIASLGASLAKKTNARKALISVFTSANSAPTKKKV